MKTYNIYRIAYEDQVEQVIVPDFTTFHILDSFDNFKETKYGSINQNTYIALILYTNENWNILKNSKKQTLALDYYNISDKWIVIVLKDVCKIDDKFPLSDENLDFPECYLKVRATRQIDDCDKTLEEIMNMSEAEKESYFRPVISYVKIHGFSKNIDGQLDVTRVDVGTWIDKRNIYKISRENERIAEVLGSNNFIRTDKSDEQEFLSAFTNIINQMK